MTKSKQRPVALIWSFRRISTPRLPEWICCKATTSNRERIRTRLSQTLGLARRLSSRPSRLKVATRIDGREGAAGGWSAAPSLGTPPEAVRGTIRTYWNFPSALRWTSSE